jgi:hypothetical protein
LAASSGKADWLYNNKEDSLNPFKSPFNRSNEDPRVNFMVLSEQSTILIAGVPIVHIYKLKFPRRHECIIQFESMSPIKISGLLIHPSVDGMPRANFLLSVKNEFNPKFYNMFMNTPGILSKNFTVTFTDINESYTFNGMKMDKPTRKVAT